MLGKMGLFGAAVILSGCAVGGVADPNAVGPYPENYKDLVKAQIRTNFFDPYSMQDVWIAPPYKARMMFRDGWMVCLKANAKNRMGGYTGQQGTGYLINSGVVVADGFQTQCPQQQYSEWKEMEMAGH